MTAVTREDGPDIDTKASRTFKNLTLEGVASSSSQVPTSEYLMKC